MALLVVDPVVLLSSSPGALGRGLKGGLSVVLGASVSLDSSVGLGLGLGLGRCDDGVDTNDVLPAKDSREVAAAGVGRESVADLELKYSEAAPASVVFTLNVVQVVERVDVTTEA